MTRFHLQVHLRHQTRALVLDVSFSVAEAATAVVGGQRSGKTKLLDLLAGFLRPDQGTIRLQGIPLVDVEKRIFVSPRRRRIGLVPKGCALFPHLTVEENLAFGIPRLHPDMLKRFQVVVNIFNLTAILKVKPQDLNPRETLHVAVARALIPLPHLLLLDEPTHMLDPDSTPEEIEEVLELIQEFDTPVLFTSRLAAGLPDTIHPVHLVPGTG